MVKQLRVAWNKITNNLKQLLLFQLLYIALGMVVVFPLATAIFRLALLSGGEAYITNTPFAEFWLKPQVILLLIVMLGFIGSYISLEFVFLGHLFASKKKQFSLCIKASLYTLKRHYFKLVIPALIFFFMVYALFDVSFKPAADVTRFVFEFGSFFMFSKTALTVVVLLLFLVFSEVLMFYYLRIHHNIPTRLASNRVIQRKIIHRLIMYAVLLSAFLLLALMREVNFMLTGLFIQGNIMLFKQIPWVFESVMVFIQIGHHLLMLMLAILMIPIFYAIMVAFTEKTDANQPLSSNEVSLSKTNRYLIIFLAVLLIGFKTIETAHLVNEMHPDGYPDIIAHRGAEEEAPENTLSAIETALDIGVQGIEFDLRMTQDGKIVLIHDSHLGRTTNDDLNQAVADVEYTMIQTLDAGFWFDEAFVGEPIPTLEEALLLIGNQTTIYLDLKTSNEHFNQTVLEEVVRLNLQEHVKILSFDYDQIVTFKTMYPDIQTVFLISTYFGNFETLIQSEYIDHIGIRGLWLRFNHDYLYLAHRYEKNVYVWTIRDDYETTYFMELGADGLIVSNPRSGKYIIDEILDEPKSNQLTRLYMRVLRK